MRTEKHSVHLLTSWQICRSQHPDKTTTALAGSSKALHWSAPRRQRLPQVRKALNYDGSDLVGDEISQPEHSLTILQTGMQHAMQHAIRRKSNKQKQIQCNINVLSDIAVTESPYALSNLIFSQSINPHFPNVITDRRPSAIAGDSEGVEHGVVLSC